ncbi:hypothetical protein KAI78_05465, partial [bacterium]|nr:hypothetical protein [bacterium]
MNNYKKENKTFFLNLELLNFSSPSIRFFYSLFSASSLTHLEHGAAVRPTESSGRSERSLELL